MSSICQSHPIDFRTAPHLLLLLAVVHTLTNPYHFLLSSQQIHNVLNSTTHNATLAIKDELSERKYHQIGGTDRNRMTLFGHLEIIQDEAEQELAAKVFGKYHRDAKAYYPGKGPHRALWSRFVVEKIYWIGGEHHFGLGLYPRNGSADVDYAPCSGFGDTHYIGWIPTDMYRNAGKGKKMAKSDNRQERLLMQLAQG